MHNTYVIKKLTADIPLHKCAPAKNARPSNRRDFLYDIMSRNELTTLNNELFKCKNH